MMKENNNIFLAGSDAPVYLAKPMHKKYSTTFVCGHLLRTYVSYDQFFNTLALYAPVQVLGDPPSFPQLRMYFMDGLFLN